jgi:putative ABC transport system permease protein
VTVSPGFTRTGATRGAIGSATTLTLADANSLSGLDGVQVVAPELTTNNLIVAGTQNETTRIVGTTPAYLSVFAYDMWVGSFLNQASVDHNLRVAVIGAATADNLSLTSSSVGSTITIGGLPFLLIGILQPKGGSTTADDQVIIPLSTAHELFTGSNNVSAIGLSATTPYRRSRLRSRPLSSSATASRTESTTSRSRRRPSCSVRSARSAMS